MLSNRAHKYLKIWNYSSALTHLKSLNLSEIYLTKYTSLTKRTCREYNWPFRLYQVMLELAITKGGGACIQ